LRSQCGLAPEQQIEVTPEDLPGAAEQEGANLIALAVQNNTELRLAQSDVQAKEFRLTGEKRGYWPTLELVSVYSLLGKFNNYALYFNHFQRNNYNLGIQAQVPIFSPSTKANVALAQTNLLAAKASLSNKQDQVSAEVRRKTRRVRETDAGKEVARLELQLVQQDLAQLQARFNEGKVSLQEIEKTRVDENEKWMALLDATFQRQQAQLDLLKTAGQLDKVLQ
jgi:outer membrane protein TolC